MESYSDILLYILTWQHLSSFPANLPTSKVMSLVYCKPAKIRPGRYSKSRTIYLHPSEIQGLRVSVMVFNATFNNISALSWRLVLLVEKTGVLRENHQPAASQIMLYRVHIAMGGTRTHNFNHLKYNTCTTQSNILIKKRN